MEIPGYQIEACFLARQWTVYYRGRSLSGEPVIIRTPAAAGVDAREIARYQNAFELAAEADPKAVLRHLELIRLHGSVALVTEDFGGAPLDSLVPEHGFRLGPLIDIALALARAIGRVHASGILLKEVAPDNVLYDAGTGTLRFMDLGVAARLTREINSANASTRIESALPYTSPELCGRIVSPVDDRSDLYSLGVTLFQLATGMLPFEQEDPASLAHAHVALAPPDISDLRGEVPRVLSDIVARLLRKNIEDRYASAAGLVHDLERCAAEYRRSGTVREFAIGEHDVSPLFRIPERLYGRDGECRQLQAAFERARYGERTVVTVSGPSGIGKTAFVDTMQRAVVSRGGAFYSGKFDQFNQNQPYLALIQAGRRMLRRELAQPEQALQQRRRELADAVGAHGRLLTEVMPELETIIGEQPAVDEVAPLDAARRFNGLVTRFLRVFATPDTLLMIFVDDLQWADPASLNLLEALAHSPGLNHLMLVLGFRSNELAAGHPARRTIAELCDNASVKLQIELAPLTTADVTELVADTLHRRPEVVLELGRHIHSVAGGNAYFVREFLLALHERGYFRFDESKRVWRWEHDTLSQQPIPDNVVDLLTHRLGTMPQYCLDLLDTASCVGGEFDLDTIASVHRCSPGRAAVGLAPAVSGGLLVPIGSEYRVYEALANWDMNPDVVRGVGAARYRFQHDQVRQTVHRRLDGRRRAERHLQVGRLLLENLSMSELEYAAVKVFNHLAYGADLVADASERREFARLGLLAGRNAQRGLAFDTARRQLVVAASFLPDTAWRTDYETMLGIQMALAECAHALGDLGQFETISDFALRNIQDPVDAARMLGLRVRVRSTEGRYAEAADICVQVANTLGVSLPRKPRLAHVLLAIGGALWTQGRREPREFEGLAECGSRRIVEAINLMNQSASAAYFSEPNLLPLIAITSTRLSLRHGMTPGSAYGFAMWALVLCGVLGRMDNGYGFGRLALDVGRRYGGVEEARARFVVNCFVKHWKEPLREVAELLRQDWELNRDAGDEESAVYCGGVQLYALFFTGESLDSDLRHAEVVRYIASSGIVHVKDCFLAWVQLHEALRGAELPAELAGDWFDLAEKLPEFERIDNRVQIAISLIAAGILDHFANRYERAHERFSVAAKWEDNIVAQLLVPGLAFFRGLNAYRLHALAPAPGLLRVARRQRARIRKWARSGPDNLDHRLSLLDAEEYLARGRTADAVLALHRAADKAGSAPMYRALANRRLGEVLADLGNIVEARAMEATSRSLYEAWGSRALARTSAPESTVEAAADREPLHTTSADVEEWDLQSMLHTIGAISSEIDEDRLLETLMGTLMRAANADRGVLILFDSEGNAMVELDASVKTGSSRRGVPLGDFRDIARPVADLVSRTGEMVVIDVNDDELVAGDAHVEASGVQAILATGIAVQTRRIGLVYLENHHARGAFNPGRVAVVEALGAQAGIALENARLYGRVQEALVEQKSLTAANRRFVPKEILAGLGYDSVVDVDLNEAFNREMHVLFADLRSFTSLSKKLGAEGTIAMINRYLSHVQPGIAVNHGFVGEYRGDSLLALFPGEPDHAVHGAVAMCRGLEGYNRDRGEFPELRFGIGIHSGQVTLGLIGDPDHMACGVMGDSVNTASRIEALTKYYGAIVLITGATRDRLIAPERFETRYLGRVAVKGRAEVMEIMESLDAYADSEREALLGTREAFEEAVDAYAEGHWSSAARLFDECVRTYPGDRVARSFLSRCQSRLSRPPPWDGIERPLQ